MFMNYEANEEKVSSNHQKLKYFFVLSICMTFDDLVSTDLKNVSIHTFKSPRIPPHGKAESRGSFAKSSVLESVLIAWFNRKNNRLICERRSVYHILFIWYTQVHIYHIPIYILSILISFSLKIGWNLKCYTDRCWRYLWIHLPIMPGTRDCRLNDLWEHLHEWFAFGKESTSYSQIEPQSMWWVKRYFYNASWEKTRISKVNIQFKTACSAKVVKPENMN